MKIQLLIGINDSDYMEHLSLVLAQRYTGLFEVSACSTKDGLEDLLSHRRFEVALLSPALASVPMVQQIQLPLLLWDGIDALDPQAESWIRLRKYQRISSLTGEILEQYSGISNRTGGSGAAGVRITAVWSPAGGSGKTTVALACAAQRVAEGRRTVYLDLEAFSSSPAYFQEAGKSISTVFGKLDEDVSLLMQGIRQQDSDSGIGYYGCPENYDDIEVLTVEDIRILVGESAGGADELVVDLSSQCDEKVRKVLGMADMVLLVVDSSSTAQVKWEQFRTQHNIYHEISGKSRLVANKGARIQDAQISLPYVQSSDPMIIYKTLSAGYFGD